MKKQKLILTVIFLFAMSTSFACSCSPIKIVNAFSILDFIGIVEFKTLTPIENNERIYKSTYVIKELFKGKKNDKIFIDSMKGSSCGFLPEKNTKYLILGYKTEEGVTKTSFCLAQRNPRNESLSILRKLTTKKMEKDIGLNLQQTVKSEINQKLFKKSINGFFLYKVCLSYDLKIMEIIPKNKNARNNFNKKIISELKKKIHYKRYEEKLKSNQKKLSSYIILNWEEGYENTKRITTAKL